MKRYTSRVAVAALVFAGSVAATAQDAQTGQPVPAAQAPGATEEIIVTGSRIKRTDLQANSPIVNLGSDEITLTSTVNAEDVIRELPQAIPGISPGVNNGNPGVATVNLRALDDERTLVLVNSKRFVGYDSEGIVDINNIPTSLIERIDVVTGGASAVYGSDAIAGVINFVMKENFEGAQFDYDYTNALRGGEATNSFGATFGVNAPDERGNLTLFAGWTDRDSVKQGDRAFSEVSLTTEDGSEGGSFTDTNGNIICFGCSYAGAGGPNFGANDFVGFQSPNGDLDGADSGARLFNFNPFNLLQVPQERYQAMAMGHYDINEWVTFYANFTFAQTQVDTVIAPSGTFFSEFDIPFDSIYLSPQARSVLFGDVNGTGAYPISFDQNGDGVVGVGPNGVDTVTYPFGRRTIEVGPRITRNRTQAWQLVGGLRGDLPFADGWSYDFSAQRGRTELSRVFENDLSGPRIQDIISASSPTINPGATDGGTCHGGAAAGCVVGSLFGDGSLNAGAAAFVALSINEEVYTTQDIVHFDVAGDLGESVKIPGASAIGLSMGAEWRRVESDSFPDDCYSTPDCSLGFGSTTAVQNDFNVKEVFAEVSVPILEDRRFAQNLVFESAFRWADYSHSGTATAWKVGGEYNPIEDFKFRVNYQSAVRAPNIYEFGQPITPVLDNSNGDPCAASALDTFTRDLCVNTGVDPTKFTETAPGSGIWNSTVPDVIAGQINAFSGGNANLKEETAKTLTIGGVYEPSFIEGLVVQIDWYRVEIEDAISNIDADNILAYCYLQSNNPSGSTGGTCAFVNRNPLSGGLVGNPNFGLIETEQNISSIKVEGVDVQLDYSVDLGTLGSLDINWLATKLIKLDDTPFAGASTNVCKGIYGPICNSPNPSVKFTQRTTWYVGDFNLGYRWRYLRGTKFEDQSVCFTGQGNYCDINDTHYMDFVVGWTPTGVDMLEGFTFQVGLENVFDEDAPIVGSEAGPTDQNSGNTFPGTFDTVGRSLTLRASKKF